MRYNGLKLVIDMAVKKVNHPLFNSYQDAIILGSIREDILFVPGLNKIFEHVSLSHFTGKYLRGGFIPLVYPGASFKTKYFFKKSLNRYRQNKKALSMVLLGRASHLIIDMACPVHATRTPHLDDGYEWVVEKNYLNLSELPFEIPNHFSTSNDIVKSLARWTQRFEPDRTHHPIGAFLKKIGLRKGLHQKQLADQAEQIIPKAAGHLAALYLLFLKEALL
jgi:zinc dependent phospholipase C